VATADLEQAAAAAPLSNMTPEQVERIIELAEAGLPWTTIAERVLGSRRRIGACLLKPPPS
jgi:hypothetical protein